MPYMKYKLMRCWLKTPNEVILDLWNEENKFGFEIHKTFVTRKKCEHIHNVLLSLNSDTHDLRAWEDILFTLSGGAI